MWDILTYMTTGALIVIMLAISRQPFWSDANTLAVIFLLLIMYSVAMTPVICLVSLFFPELASIFDVVFCKLRCATIDVNCISLSIPVLLFVVEYLETFMHAAVKALLMICPQWTLSNGILKVAKAELGNCADATKNCDRKLEIMDNSLSNARNNFVF